MPVATYHWPVLTEFRNRTAELDRLNAWWDAPAREPLNLYGRRRVGKSWLFRRLAHGKPAVILVADRVAPGQQLVRLARDLEPVVGFRPQLDDVPDLFRVLYRLGHDHKVLVVVDEFPNLLGTSSSAQRSTLSAIQAVMEAERDASDIKLILTGSAVAQMEAMQAERSPLHGRLVPFGLRPLDFAAARPLMTMSDPIEQLTRFAVAGGMPRYLAVLGGPSLPDAIARHVVDRHAQLFNEPRTLLQAELREPAVYFSVLAALSGRPQDVATVAAGMRIDAKELGRYLAMLESLQLVSRHRPLGAPVQARNSQWRCTDHFVRFWFRFVQPYQGDLEAGSDPRSHVDLVVLPQLADHAAPVFEDAARSWLRGEYAGRASTVGAWWGPALHPSRARKERFTEEVDAVAVHGRRVIAVGEAKWTTKPLDAGVLRSLMDHKLPALAQAGFDVTGCDVVAMSKSGFTDGARALAQDSPHIRLLSAATVLSDRLM